MAIKNTLYPCLLSLLPALASAQAEKPDTIYFKFNDRFTKNEVLEIRRTDSIVFENTRMRAYRPMFEGSSSIVSRNITYRQDGRYSFDKPERVLVKPSTYSGNNYSISTSNYCMERSRESEHFVVFWQKGLTLQSNGNLTGGASSSVCNVNTLLSDAENIWKVYVEKLGFLIPGASTTDNFKIQMYVVNQSDWRADGSGVDGIVYTAGSGSTRNQESVKTGIFHCNPWAASSKVTVAHEIGHTFQYLVSADLGMNHGLNYVLGENSNGNEWWEDCANWQAHKVYPAQQFAENWGNNQNMHHMNIIHEGARYNNCYYQDWWCQQHGATTVGRVWRESQRPEDPIQAYMRIFGLSLEQFADEQYQGYAHIASMDIEAWRQYGQGLIGSEQQRLIEPSQSLVTDKLNGESDWWVVDPNYCVQNFGYNANPLKVPAVGAEVQIDFKGIVGATGYRNIKSSYAGWRYGIVAYCSDGTRHYGAMGKEANGSVSMVVPDNCERMWLVVMGAPTTYWTHSWNDSDADDEQWPYAVRCHGTSPLGAHRTYGEFPADYVRKDTTVVIRCNLPYSGSAYTSVNVQYDMDAISEALGLSTAQLKAVVRNTTPTQGKLVFAGVNANGATLTYNTTTTTSSNTVYGHWFNTSGNVGSYDGSAAIFAEMTPADYICKVGQYPGRLSVGRTYTIRHAFIYTDNDNRKYRATMEVRIKVTQ